MPPDLRAMLNETEQALLREVDDLERLDEDELAALHDRIRRARSKYVKLYRRRASAQVASDRSRSRTQGANQRAVLKAELFEDALAKVSRRLATVAKSAAAELKRERLALAAQERESSVGEGRSTAGTGGDTGRKPSAKPRTPAKEKARASTKATTKRRQAARDSRSGR